MARSWIWGRKGKSNKGMGVKQGVRSRKQAKRSCKARWGLCRHHRCSAHTQRVLNVDEPAIKTKKLSNLDQSISHCLVGALIPGQEGFTEPASIAPLCDKGPCEARDRNQCLGQEHFLDIGTIGKWRHPISGTLGCGYSRHTRGPVVDKLQPWPDPATTHGGGAFCNTAWPLCLPQPTAVLMLIATTLTCEACGTRRSQEELAQQEWSSVVFNPRKLLRSSRSGDYSLPCPRPAGPGAQSHVAPPQLCPHQRRSHS